MLDKADATLKPLPGREEIPQSAKSVCPANAPVKTFNVAAIDKAIRYNKGTPGVMEVDMERKMVLGNEAGKMYVLEGEKVKVASGSPAFVAVPVVLQPLTIEPLNLVCAICLANLGFELPS